MQAEATRPAAARAPGAGRGRRAAAALGPLRDSPAAVPALVAAAVLLVLGMSEGGALPTAWYPATIFLGALLAIALFTVPAPDRPARLVVAATLLLLAYAGWCWLTIAWADQRGDALAAANRALLYVAVFGLFALWPLRPGARTALLAVLGLGTAAIGLVTLLSAASSGEPVRFFIDARLSEPVGYPNGNAALWTAAVFPCVFLAARREVPVPLRALGLAGAGLLLSLALMAVSRGWVFAVPAAGLAFVAISPNRARTLLASLPPIGAMLAASGPALAVHDRFAAAALPGLIDDAASRILLLCAALLAVGLAAGVLDRRPRLSPATERRAGSVVVGAAALAGVAALVIVLVAANRPLGQVGDAWEEFKSGDPGATAGRSRFATGLGSNRYDFWRIAWQGFERAPLAGIGAENFQQDYLQGGRSTERPRHPHSLELRALSQTGIVGALLLAAAFGAALAAAARGIRPAGLGGAAAAAGAGIFLYWLIHGSVDWFWELPAIGGVAFAGLGLAAGAGPRRPDADAPRQRPRPPAHGPAAIAVLAVVALCAVALVPPWLAVRQTSAAIASWRVEPREALARLDNAAGLDPFSAVPDLVAGAVAVRLGLQGVAGARYTAALERDPRNVYANLQLGAIAAQQGNRPEALARLDRAARLAPRDDVVARARAAVRRGGRLDPAAIGRELAERSRRRVR